VKIQRVPDKPPKSLDREQKEGIDDAVERVERGMSSENQPSLNLTMLEGPYNYPKKRGPTTSQCISENALRRTEEQNVFYQHRPHPLTKFIMKDRYEFLAEVWVRE